MTKTFLSAHWENLIMANYEINADVLIPYLPQGVELDFYNNKTYVSLVGFMFKQTSLFNIPIPFLGTFEEINLRFYVVRKEGNTIKRGVVFINETVPYKPVAWLANKLYKEHYTAVPTKNSISISDDIKTIKYEWKIKNSWNHLAVNASASKTNMQANSMEEFIFEHYYGYTKLNQQQSQEYRINHARWFTNEVKNFSVDCDFSSMYGNNFSFLKHLQPNSVIIAEGSPVTIKWKRTTF
jgi:uncharacterized protein YqjF (DUF2071 family)